MVAPTYDLSMEAHRHVVVAEGAAEVYQGHPTTVLLPDGRSIIAVWTYGHGGPCGPMKRSGDGGLTWSELLPVPDNWPTVQNCPCIYRLVDAASVARLWVFAGRGQMYQARSTDDGVTWTPMRPNGICSVMPWCSIVALGKGRYLAQTNARRQGDPDPWSNVVIQSVSDDGGENWSPARVVLDIPERKPCEPALIRSPDGRQLLSLMRENTRQCNSLAMVSDDQGGTWSEVWEVAPGLTGDRHVARYAPDGRLVVVFRDTSPASPTRDHFMAWVGTYDDIASGRDGQYRLKLLHSYAGPDCGYSGLELLPDGTFVATTYVKYKAGPAKHSVVSVRFRVDE